MGRCSIGAVAARARPAADGVGLFFLPGAGCSLIVADVVRRARRAAVAALSLALTGFFHPENMITPRATQPTAKAVSAPTREKEEDSRQSLASPRHEREESEGKQHADVFTAPNTSRVNHEEVTLRTS
jgi:hypothetical protein